MRFIVNTLRIWRALIVRDIALRSPGSRLGYLLDLSQPFMQLGLMYVVFYYINRRPDFGPSLFIFLFSGIFPFFLFTHTATRIMPVFRRARDFATLTKIGPIDLAIALAVLETLTILVMGAGALSIAGAFGIQNATPYDNSQIVLSILATSFLALGVGIFNSCLAEYFHIWRLLWSVFARSLIFFSNVFYVVDFFPPAARNILWWNPLLHGVIWFRKGLYNNYPSLTFSPIYMLSFGAVALLLGLAMERNLRREAT